MIVIVPVEMAVSRALAEATMCGPDEEADYTGTGLFERSRLVLSAFVVKLRSDPTV